jgi:hypothetical protein
MFFLTGASGSGKSASLPGLRAALPKMDWRDFDEFGVPSPCPAEWRPLTTERWIQVAVENKRHGKDTGIVGGAIMGEILACQSAPHIDEIHVALLDCHDVVRLDRLRKRGTHGVTQDMLSWAAWQRVHAVDPQWQQDVICGRQLDTMRWERWTNWHRGDPRWHVHILDSTNLTIDQVVDQIVAWVRASRHRDAHSGTRKARTVLRPARPGDFDYCARLYFEGMEKIIKELNLNMDAQVAGLRQS